MTGERYQLLGEIARGGMGVILKGRDPSLGRDLAFKVLKAELSGRQLSEQRFVEEAQVSGQLQHPGIVPVYELGRFADGRPYFTMKLLRGRTLAALLTDRPSPQSERARFLKILEQVTQTVAYAHSKGVIHRDLKPSNIMVGNYGEVQVMDWGLAKVLRDGGTADEEREDQASRNAAFPTIDEGPAGIQTDRSGSGPGSDTVAGSVLGTPSYMPPEQASGEIEKLDERADVFGLGHRSLRHLDRTSTLPGRRRGDGPSQGHSGKTGSRICSTRQKWRGCRVGVALQAVLDARARETPTPSRRGRRDHHHLPAIH